MQSSHCAFFHFVVSGLEMGSVLKLRVCNASNHGGLYKHDMRPVFRSVQANRKWTRIRSPVKFSKSDGVCTLYFEHTVEFDNDKIYFAFTYPYTYTMVQDDIETIKRHNNDFTAEDDSLYMHHEVLTKSVDGRNVDLITITSIGGADCEKREPLLSGIFPEHSADGSMRPPTFPDKEVIFLSARVHPGEVPAQWTFKGMLDLLRDKTDLRAIELRRHFVFKLIPLLNPDGVFRGHFRMDQFGNNLNRYYTAPDPTNQPTIFAAKALLDYYSDKKLLSAYVDCHAHASKRGCFIYGNVMDSLDDQVQNQLYCQLISMNTPHFDYEGCLFSKEHMTRIDPGDAKKGLTAEGSGRVATYLHYGIIHSYTIESNYNCSRTGNDVPACEVDPLGSFGDKDGFQYTPNPEKYTTVSYNSVGRAVLIAMLDIRNVNPASRIPRSRHRSLENMRQKMLDMVKNKKEYRQAAAALRRQTAPSVAQLRRGGKSGARTAGGACTGVNNDVGQRWRRCVSAPTSEEGDELTQNASLKMIARENGSKKENRAAARARGSRVGYSAVQASPSNIRDSSNIIGSVSSSGRSNKPQRAPGRRVVANSDRNKNMDDTLGTGRNPLMDDVVSNITPRANASENQQDTLVPPVANDGRRQLLPSEVEGNRGAVFPSVFPAAQVQQYVDMSTGAVAMTGAAALAQSERGLEVYQQRQLIPVPARTGISPHDEVLSRREPTEGIVMMGSKKILARSMASDSAAPIANRDEAAAVEGAVARRKMGPESIRLAPLLPPELDRTAALPPGPVESKIAAHPPYSPASAHALAAAVLANRNTTEATMGSTSGKHLRRNPFPPKGSPRRATGRHGALNDATLNHGGRSTRIPTNRRRKKP